MKVRVAPKAQTRKNFLAWQGRKGRFLMIAPPAMSEISHWNWPFDPDQTGRMPPSQRRRLATIEAFYQDSQVNSSGLTSNLLKNASNNFGDMHQIIASFYCFRVNQDLSTTGRREASPSPTPNLLELPGNVSFGQTIRKTNTSFKKHRKNSYLQSGFTILLGFVNF